LSPDERHELGRHHEKLTDDVRTEKGRNKTRGAEGVHESANPDDCLSSPHSNPEGGLPGLVSGSPRFTTRPNVGDALLVGDSPTVRATPVPSSLAQPVPSPSFPPEQANPALLGQEGSSSARTAAESDTMKPKSVSKLTVYLPPAMRARFAVLNAVLQAKIHRQFVYRACGKFLGSVFLLITQLLYPVLFDTHPRSIPEPWPQYFEQKVMQVPHGPRVAIIVFFFDVIETMATIYWHRDSSLVVFREILCDELLCPSSLFLWFSVMMLSLSGVGTFINTEE
jgi:hypothetical protein